MENFIESVLEDCGSKNTILVAGFDPRLETIPPVFGQGDTSKLSPEKLTKLLDDFFELFLDATKDHICAVKPNSAFFEQHGIAGLEALSRLLKRCDEARVQTILDVKRGDIGSTAEAYARAYLGPLGDDEPPSSSDFLSGAVTVNPFLGMDSLEPFVRAARNNGKGIFVLLRTSNPGAKDLQSFGKGTAGGELTSHLSGLLAGLAEELSWDTYYSGLGVVVGATCAEYFEELRVRLPRSLFLAPGVGAQGGDVRALSQLFNKEGMGVLVPVSRELLSSTRECSSSAAVSDKFKCNIMALNAELQR